MTSEVDPNFFINVDGFYPLVDASKYTGSPLPLGVVRQRLVLLDKTVGRYSEGSHVNESIWNGVSTSS
jgi:hypothetical protein